MSEISAEHIRHLLNAEHDRPRCEAERYCIVNGPRIVQDRSRIFYAECDRFPTPVAVKCCLKSGTLTPDPIDASRQFHGLQRVYESMNDNCELTVPRPYELFERYGIIVSEWIQGVTITERLFSRSCTREQALMLTAGAANWLRRFHAAHRLTPSPLNVEEMLEFVGEMEACETVNSDEFRKGIEALRKAGPAAEQIELEQSWVHGDFKADNLMVSEARIFGIDVYVRHENAVLYDLAPFMNHIELSYFSPNRWRCAVGRDQLLDSFQSCYLGARLKVVLVPLVWLRLYMMLNRWSSIDRKVSNWRSFLSHHCFQRSVRRLASELQSLC